MLLLEVTNIHLPYNSCHGSSLKTYTITKCWAVLYRLATLEVYLYLYFYQLLIKKMNISMLCSSLKIIHTNM